MYIIYITVAANFHEKCFIIGNQNFPGNCLGATSFPLFSMNVLVFFKKIVMVYESVFSQLSKFLYVYFI